MDEPTEDSLKEVSATNSENRAEAYFILDIESVPDGRLIQKTQYPDLKKLSKEDASEKYKKERLETTGSDFIPYVFQVPVSVAFIKTKSKTDLNIDKIATLDRPTFRPHKITKDFWNVWQNYQKPTWVSFNGRTFDLPLMELAAFRYGISAPKWFNESELTPVYKLSRYRYTYKYHFDLMEYLTNYGATRFVGGLNLTATLLGKPGKFQTKGSMVESLWKEEKKLTIDDYCLCDTLDTYFTFLRVQVLRGQITLTEEKSIVENTHRFIGEKTKKYPLLEEYLKNFHFWEAPEEDSDGFLH